MLYVKGYAQFYLDSLQTPCTVPLLLSVAPDALLSKTLLVRCLAFPLFVVEKRSRTTHGFMSEVRISVSSVQPCARTQDDWSFVLNKLISSLAKLELVLC